MTERLKLYRLAALGSVAPLAFVQGWAWYARERASLTHWPVGPKEA